MKIFILELFSDYFVLRHPVQVPHLQPQWNPVEKCARLNHHLSGLFGVSSLARTGHSVHVAIPESGREHIKWDNFNNVRQYP